MAVAVCGADIKHVKTPETFSARHPAPAVCARHIKHSTGQITLLKLKKMTDEDVYAHTHLSVLASTLYYSCEPEPTMGSSHGESCLCLAPVGLSPASLRVSAAVSHGSGRPQLCFTYEASEHLSAHCQALTRTSYLSSSKHAALWSRQLAHITAVGYMVVLCWRPMSHFSSFAADSLPLYPARYRQRLLISPRHCFTEGFCAALPWQTVRLHSDYKRLNIVWQHLPREGLTIMFH